jgi:hypothetical protein
MSVVAWNAEAIIADALEAARQATDETLGAAVAVAQRRVRKKTRRLMGAIKAQPAEIVGDVVVGTFGVHAEDDPGYALAQEFLPEDNAPGEGEEGGRRRPRGRAYVRPAGDQEFPEHRGRVERRLRR